MSVESAIRELIAICRQVEAAMDALEDRPECYTDFSAAVRNMERWCAPDARIDLDRITSALYRCQNTYNALLDDYRMVLAAPARLSQMEAHGQTEAVWMLERCAQPLHAAGTRLGQCRQELLVLSLARFGRLPAPPPENAG